MAQKKDLETKILDFIKKNSSDPNEILTALGRCMYIAAGAAIRMFQEESEPGRKHEPVLQVLNFIHSIEKKLQDEYTEKDPEHSYMTHEEFFEMTKSLINDSRNEDKDKKCRINGCRLIMNANNIGYLLLALMDDGAVQMSSNLENENHRDKVLSIMKETLFDADHRVRPASPSNE